eukprot:3574530-Ditylum_brightwellii.AAC.1
MQYTDHTQAAISISLSLFKALVKNQVTNAWKLQETQRLESNLRWRLLDDKKALVRRRVLSPRPLQCLFTCY